MSAQNREKILSVKIWRHLSNFWATVLYVVIVADFYYKNSLTEFIGPISAIYVAVLAIYSAQKEFERWHDFNVGRHPGELYVVVWTILVFSFFILELFYKGIYKLPSEVVTTYIVVIGVLAITKRSKRNYQAGKRRR